MEERKFYIDFNSIRYCYPNEIHRHIHNFGALDEYKDKRYTLREANELVAQLILRTPYVPNALSLQINIMSNRGYHHMLNLKNYDYESQNREDEPCISYLFES